MNESAIILAKKFDGYVGSEVNIFPLMNLFALDTVCGRYFNLNINKHNFYYLTTLIIRIHNG